MNLTKEKFKLLYLIALISIAFLVLFKFHNISVKKQEYLNSLKIIDYKNVVSIKFYGLYEITNRNDINNLIFSLKSSFVTDKYYFSGENSFDCNMKILFKDKSYLILKLRDYDVKSDKLYIYIEDWKGKKLDELVIANLFIGNNELKSVLKKLKLPNWNNNGGK